MYVEATPALTCPERVLIRGKELISARIKQTTMLGDLANNLVLESSRSIQTRRLIGYNTTSIRLLARESKSLDDQLIEASNLFTSQVGYDEGQAGELIITALNLRRNKRALCVYHQQRLNLIQHLLWENGGLLSIATANTTATGGGAELKKNLATVDQAFIKSYEELCLRYRNNNNLMDAMDILGGGVEYAQPPTEVFVNVRVMREVGEIETVHGTIKLTKGNQYFMNRDEVANLIVQGYLEEM